jgi:UDP-N-acetylmuramoylalanine-D-glutamate ligase
MEPGEELLFSPACASFDAHLNFRERALAFQAALPR